MPQAVYWDALHLLKPLQVTVLPHLQPESHADHGHLSLRQCARLVTANHGGGAQSLYGGKLAHKHFLLHLRTGEAI